MDSYTFVMFVKEEVDNLGGCNKNNVGTDHSNKGES